MGEIRIIEAPEIYLVGRQSVDEAELARFLSDEGVDGWTFSFTTAVRAELRRELDRRFPNEVRSLVRVTAQWCLEQNHHYAALRHAIEGGGR